MSMHPLKQDDDEVQRVLTRVFHETGYRVNRNDPVIVPYVVQKIMLGDFKKEEAGLFAQFSEKTVAVIKAETEKLEKQSGKLMELSRTTAADTVRTVGSEYTQHIRDTMRKVDNAVFENVSSLTKHLKSEQDAFLKKVEEAHQEFADTANQFNKITMRLFLVTIAFVGIMGFIMGYWSR